jgi:hypothetical protein
MFVCAPLLMPSLSATAEEWLALTLAPDGAWGAAASGNLSASMAIAIARCNERSSRPRGALTGCGALLRMARHGWGVAETCGTHWMISVERTLAEAEYYLRAWKLSMKYEHGVKLPQCRRVVTVGPDGNEYDFIQY